jgi:hypothetical protein
MRYFIQNETVQSAHFFHLCRLIKYVHFTRHRQVKLELLPMETTFRPYQLYVYVLLHNKLINLQ